MFFIMIFVAANETKRANYDELIGIEIKLYIICNMVLVRTDS